MITEVDETYISIDNGDMVFTLDDSEYSIANNTTVVLMHAVENLLQVILAVKMHKIATMEELVRMTNEVHSRITQPLDDQLEDTQ